MKIDKKTKVLAFMNAFTSGISGGDVAFIEIFKRLDFNNLTVVTSKLGRKLCIAGGLKAKFVLTSNEDKFSHTIFIYFFRIIKALCVIPTYDLIYSSSDSLPDILPALWLKIRNKNMKWIVKRYHNIPVIRMIPHTFQKISLFFINNLADLVIQDGLFGFDNKNTDKIKASKEKHDAVFMSRLHESKGVFDLIEIWKNVVLEKPTAVLCVMGTGSEKIISQLNELILKYKLTKNIKTLGFLDDNKSFAIIKSSKLFLFPSHEEAFGLVLGETMHCRVPIIAYALPALKWSETHVFKVPCFEKEYFSKLICGLLADEKKRIKYVKDAYKFSKSFTWKKAAEYERAKIYEN